jgi:hypothetical protein
MPCIISKTEFQQILSENSQNSKNQIIQFFWEATAAIDIQNGFILKKKRI